jgi:hypothetical protein
MNLGCKAADLSTRITSVVSQVTDGANIVVSEARAGESFIKIGVGLLAKGQSEDYLFHENYRLIRAGEWGIVNGVGLDTVRSAVLG